MLKEGSGRKPLAAGTRPCVMTLRMRFYKPGCTKRSHRSVQNSSSSPTVIAFAALSFHTSGYDINLSKSNISCLNVALCFQVYLELGKDFEALQAATRATRLLPQMTEAYLTLGRAQLNYGEPGLAQKSLEKVLQLQVYTDTLAYQY